MIVVLMQKASGQVVIKEVLYNPFNSENIGEAILLYNAGNQDVNVSEWIIATKTSAVDATIPQGFLIAAGGNLLIADIGFSLDKYNSSWPNADYEEAITLTNSDAGVALLNGSNIIDSVGWGNASIIGQGFYEGTPHKGVSEGQSLRRIDNQDTNNNSADFYAATPTFYSDENNDSGKSIENNSSTEIIINVEVNITKNPPKIKKLQILSDDDLSKEGIQINPVAGNTRTFEVLVETYDQDNNSDVQSAKALIGNKEFELLIISNNKTGVVFSGNISMEYYEEPKNYTLQVVVNANGREVSQSTEFEYKQHRAISSVSSLGFEVLAGNSTQKTVIVKNTGNVDVQLNVKGTELSKGEEKIPIQNILYSEDNFATSRLLANSFQVLGVLPRKENKEITFKVLTWKELSSGTYNGQIIISGD